MMEILELPFMRTALLASLLAGNAVALLGVFVLMRRVAFSGLAVSQLAALGGVIGILLGLHNSFPITLALVFGGLAALPRLSRHRRVPAESWVAALYVFGAAAAVLLLARAPHGEAHTMNVFFGNVLTLGTLEVVEALALLLVVVTAIGTCLHRWIWMSFDAQSAEVAGIRVGRWNVFFFALLAVAMTFAIHVFGVLLAFAYLILPATAAMLMAGGVRSLFVAVPVVTTLATLAGFILSFKWDLPTGPFVSGLLATVAVLAGFLSRSRRG